MLRRPPRPALRPFVSMLWAKDAGPMPVGPWRELVLPAGEMHIAIRLGDNPLRLFSSRGDPDGEAVGTSVLNGARAKPYCKDTGNPAPSVGAMLRPGAVELLSNTPAGALAGRHTRLEDLWSPCALAELRERLGAEPSLAGRLAIFESVLAIRLPVLRGLDPLIAHALFRFDGGAPVGDVVLESGFSHRHVVRVFTEAVGVSPKTYLRLRRFNRTLQRLHGAPDMSLADLAAAMDYADQAHMSREFFDFAGLPPGRYRRLAPVAMRHVPLGD